MATRTVSPALFFCHFSLLAFQPYPPSGPTTAPHCTPNSAPTDDDAPAFAAVPGSAPFTAADHDEFEVANGQSEERCTRARRKDGHGGEEAEFGSQTGDGEVAESPGRYES